MTVSDTEQSTSLLPAPLINVELEHPLPPNSPQDDHKPFECEPSVDETVKILL